MDQKAEAEPMVTKVRRLQQMVMEHFYDMADRTTAMNCEFIAQDGRVYFGKKTKQFHDAEHHHKLMIAAPGPGAAEEVAKALNRVLQPCREREKMVAREAALQFQADIAQLAEALANREIAEINAANLIETKTEVCEPPSAEPKGNTVLKVDGYEVERVEIGGNPNILPGDRIAAMEDEELAGAALRAAREKEYATKVAARKELVHQQLHAAVHGVMADHRAAQVESVQQNLQPIPPSPANKTFGEGFNEDCTEQAACEKQQGLLAAANPRLMPRP